MPFSAIARSALVSTLAVSLLAVGAAPSFAQCLEKPPLQNFTGGGASICPCFVANEQAGAILQAPAGDYPIEILRVGIAWASQLGTSGSTLQDAIHIYSAGLPNPGFPIFTLPGPLLQDGFVNEYDLEPIFGEIVVNSGVFTVTLEFLTDNSGDFFAPSMMTDGNGCQSGKNIIYANPGGWVNACSFGLSGDWVVYAIYRKFCQVGVGEEGIAMSRPAILTAPRPNPFSSSTEIQFLIAETRHVTVTVHDVKGAFVRELSRGEFAAGPHDLIWDGTNAGGEKVGAGIYFVKMVAGDYEATQKVMLDR